jgi:DNA gyrase/topoisomerase IV subunit A
LYIDRNIENIIEDNMMDFSQYVIKNRALPDLYSGMKPIHLKILWSMFENKTFNFTKSANVSGKVMVYSPHGDCYETIVNLVQNDRHIYNLINGQGNWGSSCSTDMQYAASRYTECKLSDLGIDCLQGISKNMVEMIPNYDNTKLMPKYLPTRFPLILCMASNGIAVGMANNSPSFNLEDVCNATVTHLKEEEIPLLLPDFATGGYMVDHTTEITNINQNGTGTIKLRAKYHIEDNAIIIDEIPYGTKVNIESIVNKIVEMCKQGKLKEITNVLNLTGINGLRIEITCKKGTDLELLMAKLYKTTPLESNFNVNMNVLLNGSPKVIGVRDTIKEWVKFRKICVLNGLKFELEKLSSELHLLYGLEKVLLDIDRAISIIRNSNNIESELMKYFGIDDKQAEHIINIKLRDINKNYIINKISYIKDMKEKMINLETTIKSEELINKIIIDDLLDVIKKYKQPRRTTLIQEYEIEEINKSDLIQDYNTKLILTDGQYLKKIPLTSLRGKGADEQKLKENDKIIQELESTNKSSILLFSNKANRYKLNAYDIDDAKPSTLGEYIPNLIQLEPDEKVIKIVSLEDESKAKGYILSVYANGKISKVDIQSFVSANKKLQNCYSNESELLDIEYIKEDVDVLMISEEGKSLIVSSSEISSKQSRNSQGNIAMNLGETEENKVISCMIKPNQSLYFTLVTSKNKEKEFRLDDIPPNAREQETRSLYVYLQGRARNQGNFLINTRTTNDSVKKIIFH